MKLKIYQSKHGLTLIETLVYLAIVSVFLVTIITFSDHVISVRTKARTMEEVQQNARFALMRIAQEVRSAESINTDSSLSSNLATGGGFLHLNKATSSEDIYFQVTDGQLTIKTGASGSEQALTSNLLEVQELTFTPLANTSDPRALKVSFSIKFANNNNFHEYDWQLDLSDTLTIRKP